jgi:uncharacterized protein (DUF433 family)
MATTLESIALVVPLTERDGVIRVGSTRVSLESVLVAFNQGSTPGDIAEQYPSISLPDVFTVIAYYLQNRSQLDSYLAEQRNRRSQVERDLEVRYDVSGFRRRLLDRRGNP